MTGALFRDVYLQLYPEVNPHCSRKIGEMHIAYLSIVQGKLDEFGAMFFTMGTGISHQIRTILCD